MMRLLFPTLALAVLVATAGPAHAQGCTADSPCLLEVTVDEDGFSDQREWNVTTGDTFRITLENLDLDATHTVTLEGYGVTLTAGPLEGDNATVTFDQVGDFFFADEPTADQATLHILDVDVVEYEEGSEEAADNAADPTATATAGPEDDPSTPAAPVAVLLGLLAALVVALRRRK